MSDSLPQTLLQAVTYFADEDKAIQFVADMRWPDGEQVCPKCGSVAEHYFMQTRKRWKCRDCRHQFSVKVGTIFEGSPLKLSKWMPAVWMLANSKNGISSYELARALGVTQKTAWFMLHRIREAMKDMDFRMMRGEVEVDETYIGGKAINMHRSKRKRMNFGGGPRHKTAVMGLLERPRGSEHSLVRTRVLDKVDASRVQTQIRVNVNPGASLYTDSAAVYKRLAPDFMHEVVDHVAEYVRGRVHTNGIENFWSLVKRALHGTYVSVEPFHVFRYVDEAAYRFNTRKATDGQRFLRLLKHAVGRRLTYAVLTGAEAYQT